MTVNVKVELKSAVLDPQGKAIAHSLHTLGFQGVEDVRAGKMFRITLSDDGRTKEELEQAIRQMCEKLLANTVMENYTFEISR